VTAVPPGEVFYLLDFTQSRIEHEISYHHYMILHAEIDDAEGEAPYREQLYLNLSEDHFTLAVRGISKRLPWAIVLLAAILAAALLK
jgi:hypothetical protein